MSESTDKTPGNRVSRKAKFFLLLAVAAGLSAVSLWFTLKPMDVSDRMFQGKPESEWIKGLKYADDDQAKEWRSFGEEGVQVLIRGLQRADRPGERAYRRLYRRVPGFVRGWLPSPRADSTRNTRMCVVSLLSRLGNDAKSAVPIMIQTLNHDEADGVRQIVINYFTSTEDENCLLNQIPAREKANVLPALIRALQDQSNWGLRNNAASALRWFPEQRKIVAPVLVTALRDPKTQVRLLAAIALNRVDPDAAQKARAVAVVTAILKDPDDQVASRAAAALRFFAADAAVAVPALIDCLDSTNTLIACEAIWSLEWSPPEFKPYADKIVPALEKTAMRDDHVGRYAKVALKRFESSLIPAQGTK